jgi:8-oxo-dGTP pyrophosphatase MutT (NUDIX family)
MAEKLGVVTFVTMMKNGRLQLQVRGFAHPVPGRAIADPGFFSINGGGIKEGETLEAALLREAREELGVDVSGAFAFIGEVRDEAMKRTNHVFVVHDYDQLLAKQIDTVGAIKVLMEPEGIGRACVWLEDLEAIIAEKRLTEISVTILKAFPRLMPPPRPQRA